MVTTSKVNNKITIKIPTPKYFHCYKLNESRYALFDIKMDMPVVIGSLAIIKSVKLPPNSKVFFYKIGAKGFFEKGPSKTIEVEGEAVHQKPPLRYEKVDPQNTFYHIFKLSPILYVLWGNDVKMPIVYGSYQKIQMTINQLPKNSIIYYYKEDVTVKNSFKFYMMYEGKGK